jgi:hypothetical protein
METFLLTALAAFALHMLKSRAERKRIRLLGQHLAQFEIEKLLETVTEGYQRALGEADAQRRASIWQLLGAAEKKLSAQFTQLAQSFALEAEADTRVNRLPWPLSEAAGWLPRSSLDMRKLLTLHAEGIARATQLGTDDNATAADAASADDSAERAHAFTLSAELFLMQHSCHWFCKSRGVASARLLVRHKTPYAKVLDSVTPATRRAYAALVDKA